MKRSNRDPTEHRLGVAIPAGESYSLDAVVIMAEDDVVVVHRIGVAAVGNANRPLRLGAVCAVWTFAAFVASCIPIELVVVEGSSFVEAGVDVGLRTPEVLVERRHARVLGSVKSLDRCGGSVGKSELCVNELLGEVEQIHESAGGVWCWCRGAEFLWLAGWTGVDVCDDGRLRTGGDHTQFRINLEAGYDCNSGGFVRHHQRDQKASIGYQPRES